MNKENVKKLLTPKVIVYAVVIVLVLAYVGYARSASRVTWTMFRTPQAEIQLVNDEGRTIKMDVRYVNNPRTGDNPFRNVGVNTINRNNVYYSYTRDSSATHNTRDIKAPIEMAFFDAEGNLLNIFRAQADSRTSFRAINDDGERIPYRFIIMSSEGFFAKNSISEGTEAKLLPNTFRAKK